MLHPVAALAAIDVLRLAEEGIGVRTTVRSLTVARASLAASLVTTTSVVAVVLLL